MSEELVESFINCGFPQKLAKGIGYLESGIKRLDNIDRKNFNTSNVVSDLLPSEILYCLMPRERRLVQIEALITLVVIFAGFFFGITKSEWIIIVFTVSLVLVSEAINTAIEAICDAVHKEYSKEIKYAKDVGAVLLAAMASVAIGFAIFWPYIMDFIEKI